MAHSAHKTKEEYKEHFDTSAVLEAKIEKLARWVSESKHFTVFTGAGISTSCGIPDFRSGLNTKLDTGAGAWTLRAAGQARNKKAKLVSTTKAVPSPTHMALCQLQEAGYLKYLISQNCDGLHRRSGFPPNKLSELHGNTNLEICQKCGKNYMRDFRTRGARSVHDHTTGRRCTRTGCSGELHDSIINFGENLPQDVLRRGEKNCKKSDICLVLGSSLRVTPAANLPESVAAHGRLVIVNLQSTPLDDDAVSSGGMRINGFCDAIMEGLMRKLRLNIPKFILRRYVRLTKPQNGENRLSLDCIDQDSTPMSLLLEVVARFNKGHEQARFGSGRKVIKLQKDRLGQSFDLPTGTETALLRFFGHYQEADLNFPLAEAYRILSPGQSAIYRIGWDFQQRKWVECELISPISEARTHPNVARPKKHPRQPLKLQVGNRHEKLGNGDSDQNVHLWTMYVNASDARAVESVTYKLHPTFKPNTITLTQAPFEMARRGWGTFDVGVEIKVKGMASLVTTTHHLNFSSPDTKKELVLNVAS